jgi:hypothetical protein
VGEGDECFEEGGDGFEAERGGFMLLVVADGAASVSRGFGDEHGGLAEAGEGALGLVEGRGDGDLSASGGIAVVLSVS